MPRPKKKHLWDKFKEAREKRNLTQSEVSDISGVSMISIAKLETNAVKSPWIITVTKIARALETSIDSLVEGLFKEDKDKSKNKK